MQTSAMSTLHTVCQAETSYTRNCKEFFNPSWQSNADPDHHRNLITSKMDHRGV